MQTYRPKLMLSAPTLARMSDRLGGSRSERMAFLQGPGAYIRNNADFSAFKDVRIITDERELENVNGGVLVAGLVVFVVFHMGAAVTNSVVAGAAVVVYAGMWLWGPSIGG